MKILKNYQEIAIIQLKTLTNMYFSTEESKTIIFQSPTGSGKTFMMSNYISDIVSECDLDLCFLWVSIGDGELHVQSKKSVEKDIDPKIKCSLLEEEFFGVRSKIKKNEIVFLNWEKIRAKNKKTGEFTNKIMKEQDGINFIEVLENTRESNIKIVLIIDESHTSANTERAKEIRDEIIKPFITIEMSATPVLSDFSTKVVVDSNKVIQEQMIKKEVIINDGISKIDDDEITSENLILECAFNKHKELVEEYKKEGSKVNPLTLIQLPNSTAGELKKENVLKFLESKNVSKEKIAIWLSDEKINQEYETLNLPDSKIDFLIFKQAIDTGWDCPRAQILIKFRETNSIIFEIQTVGRILRMPEAKHYNEENLNKAYVYSNIKSIEIKKEVYNPNIIKSLYSKRKDIYNNEVFKSYYRNRVDFGDVTKSYKIFFEKEFCLEFDIKYVEDELIDYDDSITNVQKKGISFSKSKLDSIIDGLNFSTKDIDKGIKINDSNTLNINLSDSDLEISFNNLIVKNLNGFAPKRSIPTIKQAILYTFRKYLNIKPANGGIVLIQNVVVSNSDLFAKIISNSIESYKGFRKDELDKKTPGRENENWEIPISKNYNPITNKMIDSNLSLFSPLYLPINKNGEVDKLEMKFIKYLESNSDNINWFWKNGDEHMESNFGIRKSDGYTFQPDFIISFKNGSYGIFDTKAGMGFNENDNEDKSNALYKYVTEERFKGKNLIGGLVVLDNDTFKYYQQATYRAYKESPELWEYFDNLLK